MIYLNLFFIFFKVGLFGFGGGYAILPMIYQEIQTFGIMTPDDFSNLVALSQVTPGPIAINAATYVGYKAAGLLGAVIATTSVSLPSFILIMIALAFMRHFRESQTLQNILAGIKPATVGLMFSAFIFMAETALLRSMDEPITLATLTDNIEWLGVAIFLLSLLAIRLTRIGAITLTLVSGAVSLLLAVVFG